MARTGRYNIPREFKDEDVWFRWFTKKQLLYLVIFGGVGLLVLYLTSLINMVVVGGVIFIGLFVLGIVLPRFNMPNDKYLWGGGMPLETIFIRTVKKAFSKKSVYIKKHNKEISD